MQLTGEVIVELENCAIAVFDDPDHLAAATGELDRAGYEYFLLEGETGQESLHPHPESLAATLQRLAAAFGDELRIIDRLDRSLAAGDQVVVVKTEGNQDEVAGMLQANGGRFLWQFREWTFNPAGSAESDAPALEEGG